MLKLKTFKILALSFTLLTMPCASNEQSLEENPALSVKSTIVQYAERSRHLDSHRNQECKKKIKPLKLAQFAGPWVLNFSSVGGVSGSTRVGRSDSADGQIVFDKFGNGTFNFLEIVTYSGTPGQVILTSFTPGEVGITVSLIDPIFGTGTLVVTELTTGTIIETANFVIIRSQVDGSPIAVQGHSTSVTPTLEAVHSWTAVKQFQ